MKIILRKYTRYHASRDWVAQPQHDQEFPSQEEAEAAWRPKQKEALRNAGASDTDEEYRVIFDSGTAGAKALVPIIAHGGAYLREHHNDRGVQQVCQALIWRGDSARLWGVTVEGAVRVGNVSCAPQAAIAAAIQASGILNR